MIAVKKVMKMQSLAGGYPHQYLVKYPENPKDIPAAMLNYAFRDGLPSPQNFAGLEADANLVKLRSPKCNKCMEDVEKRIVRELRRQIVGLSKSIPSMPRPFGEDT